MISFYEGYLQNQKAIQPSPCSVSFVQLFNVLLFLSTIKTWRVSYVQHGTHCSEEIKIRKTVLKTLVQNNIYIGKILSMK